MKARPQPNRIRRDRDRHGRGLRGQLLPATLPASRSRAERFDALVVEALGPIESRWRAELAHLDVLVEEVPEIAASHDTYKVVSDGEIVLARLIPAGAGQRSRLVLYRRPLEARGKNGADMPDLIHDILVEQIAHYLGLDPESLE